MPDHAELAVRILIAVLLGSLVGLERELTGQVAGLRTHLTVALGAALFGIVSAYGFTEFVTTRDATTYQVDPTRVASNIVTGVGFLGGGAIIKHGASVRGLTTAASMWVTAAIGLAIGLGSYFEGILSAVVLIVALTVLRAPRRWLRERFAPSRETVVIEMLDPGDSGGVISALHQLPGVEVRSLSVRQRDGKTMIEADLKGADLSSQLARLAEHAAVGAVDVNA